METFSALLAIYARNSPVTVAWMNCWVNNREAGNLRRHRAHYDVTVLKEVGVADQHTDLKICGQKTQERIMMEF